jgi:hypothetical protein
VQIDFHFGATYVLARFAGFSPAEADVVAHSAQYVDDATQAGEVHFKNGMRFTRASSAHKMLDYANLDPFKMRTSWLPFHFLPGNKGEPKPDVPPLYTLEEFLERCVCQPNSQVARDMMHAIISRQDRPYALHRLGIATHTFVDTWAHQKFVGFKSPINQAREIVGENDQHHELTFVERLKREYGDKIDVLEGHFVNDAFPLGHGGVVSYPDRPYLKWSYTDHFGNRAVRDNTAIFKEAAHECHQNFCRYREYPSLGEAVFAKHYPEPAAFTEFDKALAEIIDEDGDARLVKWQAMIANGRFGFKESADYVANGDDSWRALAIGSDEDDAGSEEFPVDYRAGFPTSNWKLFHSALLAHQFFVLHELLPDYGLLAA